MAAASGHSYPSDFVTFCVDQNVLKFGSFTLKSGRQSPYFFNAGSFSSGLSTGKLGEFYAHALLQSGLEFDCLFYVVSGDKHVKLTCGNGTEVWTRWGGLLVRGGGAGCELSTSWEGAA